MADQTRKRLMTTDDEIWEVRPKNTPFMAKVTIKDYEMKIFEILV